MGLRFFFKRVFDKSRSERIDFLAMVYSAILLSIESSIKCSESDPIKEISRMLNLDRDDENRLKNKMKIYSDCYARADCTLNDLIKKIGKCVKKNPGWIHRVTIGTIDLLKVENEPLQDRVVEFIEVLKKGK